MDCQDCCPLEGMLLLHSHCCPAPSHLAAQIGAGDDENWCKIDRVGHCRRSRVSLPLVAENKTAQNPSGPWFMDKWNCFPRVIACICFWLQKSQMPSFHHTLLAAAAYHISKRKWGAPHHAEWCHAPATHGTAPLPDVGSLLPHPEGAGRSAGSGEQSADTKPHAPVSSAEWSSCLPWGLQQISWEKKQICQNMWNT